jgi:hypothetical protein
VCPNRNRPPPEHPQLFFGGTNVDLTPSRIRKTLENKSNMEDDRLSVLENQLAQAKQIAEEADKKYEEVRRSSASRCRCSDRGGGTKVIIISSLYLPILPSFLICFFLFLSFFRLLFAPSSANPKPAQL